MKKYYVKEELAGKIVYSLKATKIGEVTDIGYSKDGEIALIIKPIKGKEEMVPFQSIYEIGEIILLKEGTQLSSISAYQTISAINQKNIKTTKHDHEKNTRTPKQALPIECFHCGKKNRPNAKFCIKCGDKFIKRASS